MALKNVSLLASFLLLVCVTASEDFNYTEYVSYVPVIKNGQVLFMTEELKKKLVEEASTFHWTPWLRTRTTVTENLVDQVCPEGDSLGSFPDSVFTDEALRSGAVALYMILAIYTFSFLAIVCNDYFVPCVELICEDLKIPQNVAAATFMAVATSCPEFFVNVISTFLTESDMGIGTIVGSAMFNALGVAAVGGLAASTPIALEPRPVTRDVIIYITNVAVLVGIVWDGQVAWYEAMVLGILYVLYFVIMFNSTKLFILFDKMTARCCKKTSSSNYIVNDKYFEEGIENKGYLGPDLKEPGNSEKVAAVESSFEEDKPKKSLWRFPKEKSLIKQIFWLYLWPIKFVLTLIIPSPVTFRRLYPLSFFLCIVWIGANSYLVSWSMTVIGYTFFIPESVMGMTFLAFGGCLPEACSIFIMSRRGEGGIGVSNALGANSLAILFALGIPWLIRTVTLVVQGAENPVVYINSNGIDYLVGSLIVAVVCLWLTLFIGKFKLRRSLGAVFLVIYGAFITFAILVEMGYIIEIDTAFC